VARSFDTLDISSGPVGGSGGAMKEKKLSRLFLLI